MKLDGQNSSIRVGGSQLSTGAVFIAFSLELILLSIGLFRPSFNWVGRWIFLGAVLLTSLPIAVRLRRSTIRRLAWSLFLIAELLTALTGALYGKLPGGTNPFAPPKVNLVLAILISLSAAAGVVMIIHDWHRKVDRTIKVDALIGGLAVASSLALLFLHRIFKVGTQEFLATNRNENIAIGLLLFVMIVFSMSALSLVDVLTNKLVSLLAAALMILSIGEVLAVRAARLEISDWGATIDSCWISGYLLVGIVANHDRRRFYEMKPIGTRTIEIRQSRKIAAFGALAIIIVILATFFKDPPIVVELALASLIVLIVRLLISLRRERTQSDLFEEQALTDSLTGLGNRRSLAERVANNSLPTMEARGGILLIDLDNFKEVNDALGHPTGDLLLIRLSRRLKEFLGERHVARIGGDEFAIECANGTTEELMDLAEQLTDLIREPFEVNDLALSVSASIGVASRSGDDDSPDALLRQADVAMYRAKEMKSGVEHYEFEHDRNDPNRLVLYGELSDAVKNKTIEVFFQPLIDFVDRRVRGCEALARWTSSSQGPVPPDRFVPMIELQGLIAPFTAHVLDEAVRYTKSLDWIGIEHGASVNVSERDLINVEFLDVVTRIIESHNFRPDRLTIEITENVIANDNAAAIRCLQRMRDLGVRLSIDDFGTGYSTLSKLMNYPVDELKIDQLFVSNVLSSSSASAIVRASVELAHSMDLTVVAEGIEDEETFQFLGALGVNVAQGYFFARPMPARECETFLRQHIRGTSEEHVR